MTGALMWAEIHITDAVKFAAYSALAAESVPKGGGEFLVTRQSRFEVLEGDQEISCVVLLRFPTYDSALSWYRSAGYSELRVMREASAVTRLILAET
jgi:uncharacterized protein (DUF1330 family)